MTLMESQKGGARKSEKYIVKKDLSIQISFYQFHIWDFVILTESFP